MERFTRSEKAILAAAVVLAAAAAVFVWTNFMRAFPEASLEFKVNRSTSQPVAESFLKQHVPEAAAQLAGSRRAAVFELD